MERMIKILLLLVLQSATCFVLFVEADDQFDIEGPFYFSNALESIKAKRIVGWFLIVISVIRRGLL